MRPLLLLPGMLCTGELWRTQLRAIPSARSIDIHHDPSVAESARRILRTAPARFGLAGHSLGGIVALEIVRQAPHRVAALALLNTTARPPGLEHLRAWSEIERRSFDEVVRDHAEAMLPSGRRTDRRLRETVESMARGIGRSGLLTQLAAQCGRPDARPALAEVGCPTLVLAGTDDQVAPPELQRELAALVPGSRYVELDACGHLAPLERPAEVTRLLAGLLTEGCAAA